MIRNNQKRRNEKNQNCQNLFHTFNLSFKFGGISSPVNWSIGGSTLIIEDGGEITINGSGSHTFFVLNGGKLTGFGGGGSNRAWLEPQGQFAPLEGGGGGNEAIEVASISFTPLVSLPSL